MPTLTVFTPAYNRAHTLPRTYESLRRQTDKDFLWVVVDDGSKDGTAALVRQWIAEETDFEIRYAYKENGGLHTAYNTAIAQLDTELAVCIDSDDFMPDDAVEKILRCWHEHGSEKVAGITGLDYDTKGNLIGGLLPETESFNLIDLSNGRLHVKDGDKKHVFRSELYKSVAPMPVFPGEKNFNPHYMHLLISENYDMIPLNECLCIVDYQSDGMTSNMFRQYRNSPNSFCELRKLALRQGGMKLWDIARVLIHFNAETLLAGKWKAEYRALSGKYKPLMLICFPAGLLLKTIIMKKGNS